MELSYISVCIPTFSHVKCVFLIQVHYKLSLFMENRHPQNGLLIFLWKKTHSETNQGNRSGVRRKKKQQQQTLEIVQIFSLVSSKISHFPFFLFFFILHVFFFSCFFFSCFHCFLGEEGGGVFSIFSFFSRPSRRQNWKNNVEQFQL